MGHLRVKTTEKDESIQAVYNLRGETFSSKVCVNGKQTCLMVRSLMVRSRSGMALYIMLIYSNKTQFNERAQDELYQTINPIWRRRIAAIIQ